MMSSAQVVKKIRQSMCMEQEEFAHLLNITKSAICNYECGRRVPRFKIIKKMIEVAKKNGMSVTGDDFFKDDKDDSKR